MYIVVRHLFIQNQQINYSMLADGYQNISKTEKIPPRKHLIAILIYLLLIVYLIATDQPLIPSLLLLTIVAFAYFSFFRLTINR